MYIIISEYFTFFLPPELPSSPVGVKIVSIGCDNCTIEWREPRFDGGESIKTYNIYLCQDGNWAKIDSVDSFVNMYTAKKLRSDKLYLFGVAAENEVGSSKIVPVPNAITPEKKICKLTFINFLFCYLFKVQYLYFELSSVEIFSI